MGITAHWESKLNLKEERLCLDFANTVEWHASDHPSERLHEYRDLVLWSEKVGLLTPGEAARLLARAERHPEQARAAYNYALELREALYRIFRTIIEGGTPEAGDLEVLNSALARALEGVRLIPAANGFAWDWRDPEDALEGMIWPVVRSAADLLASEDLDRLGQCADDRGCGWLFIDRSRNRSRRWCDMNDCGNRAKARRHYRRQKSELESGKKVR